MDPLLDSPLRILDAGGALGLVLDRVEAEAWHTQTSTSARNTLTNASRITVSFDNLLLPGLPIVSKQYSLELLNEAASASIPRSLFLSLSLFLCLCFSVSVALCL